MCSWNRCTWYMSSTMVVDTFTLSRARTSQPLASISSELSNITKQSFCSERRHCSVSVDVLGASFWRATKMLSFFFYLNISATCLMHIFISRQREMQEAVGYARVVPETTLLRESWRVGTCQRFLSTEFIQLYNAVGWGEYSRFTCSINTSTAEMDNSSLKNQVYRYSTHIATYI